MNSHNGKILIYILINKDNNFNPKKRKISMDFLLDNDVDVLKELLPKIIDLIA